MPFPPDSSLRLHVADAWKACLRWLRHTPVADPLEQRLAPVLKVILLAMTVLQAATLIRSALLPGGPLIGGMGLFLATLNTVLTLGCLLLLWKGFFRVATQLFIAGTLSLLAAGHAQWGLDAYGGYQLGMVHPLLIAGLLLSRKTLWLTFAGLALAVVLGGWRDVAAGHFMLGEARALDGVLRNIFALLVIASILDRVVVGFQDRLHSAVRRGDELARIRDLLQLEMRERERVREQLIHAQKVEAVGRLASGVAHDFGNLLALILGYSRKGARSDDPQTLKQALAGVDAAARRANAVSQKLLSFSRQDQTRLEVFDPADALLLMQPMLRQLFDPEIELIVDVQPPAQEVRFDRAQFELVVLNIAANANHAMAKGGCFRLSLCVNAAQMQAEILFADTGTGMTPEIQARIFEPFFTTKPRGEGTGLGLAVTRDLIEQAGGELSVRSDLGLGTTFRMMLPLQRTGGVVAPQFDASMRADNSTR